MANNILESYKSLLENRSARAAKYDAQVNAAVNERKEFMNDYYRNRELRESYDRNHGRLLNEARDNALGTVLKAVYITAIEPNALSENALELANTIVDNYIKESGGANAIFNNVKDDTYLLAKIRRLVEDNAAATVEDIENPDPDKDIESAETSDDNQANIDDIINALSQAGLKVVKKEDPSEPTVADEEKLDEEKPEEEVKTEEEVNTEDEVKSEEEAPESTEEVTAEEEVKTEEEPVVSEEENKEDLNMEEEAPSTEETEKTEEVSEEEVKSEEAPESTEEVKTEEEVTEEAPEEAEKTDEETLEDDFADDEDDQPMTEEEEKTVEVTDDEVPAEDETKSEEVSEEEVKTEEAPEEADEIKSEETPESTEEVKAEEEVKSEDAPEEEPEEAEEDDDKIEIESEEDSAKGAEEADKDIEEIEAGEDEPTDIDGDGTPDVGNIEEPEDTVDTDPDKTMFQELEKEPEIQTAIEVIRNRVADAEEAFIKKNAEDKQKIDELLSKISDNIATVNKIANDDSSESKIAQESVMMAKRRIKNITENRPLTIFEKMARNINESVLKNNDVKDKFINESGIIDTELVVENTRVVYAFLETLNTLKIENVNGKYIQKMLNEIR